MDEIETCRQLLQAARERAGLSVNGWAKAANVSESGIRGFLNGDTDNISIAYLEKLARVVGRKASDFIRRLVPVVARVGAGQEVYPIDDNPRGDGLEMAVAPPGLPSGQIVAVQVVGTSMYPMMKEGWLLFYHRDALGVQDDCINKICVCQVEDGPTYVKEIHRGSSPGLFTLISWNAPPIEDVRLAWAARVLDIRPR